MRLFFSKSLAVRFLLLWLLILTSHNNLAQQDNQSSASDLRVIGLFDGAALVDYAGKQTLYRAGQSVNQDIKLIKANSKKAVFLVKGKELTLSINSNQSYHTFKEEKTPKRTMVEEKKSSTAKTAKVLRNHQNMFFTLGFINGRPVNFLVDTGATLIAMSEKTAKSLALDYRNGRKSRASTANGVVDTWHVTLSSVKVGDIELTQVAASVIKGVGMPDILLGNSFLSRLKMENDGAILTLTKKY